VRLLEKTYDKFYILRDLPGPPFFHGGDLGFLLHCIDSITPYKTPEYPPSTNLRDHASSTLGKPGAPSKCEIPHSEMYQ